MLTKRAVGFISARSAAVTSQRVSATSGRCTDSTSALGEERLTTARHGIPRLGRAVERTRATPHEDPMPNARTHVRDHRADAAEAVDPERPAVQHRGPDGALPPAGTQGGDLLGQVA